MDEAWERQRKMNVENKIKRGPCRIWTSLNTLKVAVRAKIKSSTNLRAREEQKPESLAHHRLVELSLPNKICRRDSH